MTGSIAPNRPGHHGTVVARTVGTVAISCNGVARKIEPNRLIIKKFAINRYKKNSSHPNPTKFQFTSFLDFCPTLTT